LSRPGRPPLRPPAAALFLLAAGPASAQAPAPSAADLAVRLAGASAVTGYERALGDTLLALLPGSRRDRAGNIVLELGRGEPRRLAACPLDETGYVVGRIRPDGYLTLRRSPGSPPAAGPLFDQQLEGQRVTVFGARGPVPAVVAVRSIHLTRGRPPPSEQLFPLDDAYVDVGASADREAAALGIRVLAPVTLAKRPHRYGADRLAAPVAGRRAACAALLAAARAVAGARAAGTTVVAFVVEQNLAARGLRALAATRGPFAETRVADGEAPAAGAVPTAALGAFRPWSLPARYAGTPVETVSLADVERLARSIEAWLRGAEP